MAASSYNLIVDRIHSTVFSATCHVTDGCKDDTLSLLGMLNCAIDLDHFDQKTYSYYRGLIDKWISSHSGRTFITIRSTIQVIQDPRFKKNESLAEMIFELIHAFKKEIYDRFGFSPKETTREQVFSEAKVTRHHGKISSRPIAFNLLKETRFSITPTTSGIAYATVSK